MHDWYVRKHKLYPGLPALWYGLFHPGKHGRYCSALAYATRRLFASLTVVDVESTGLAQSARVVQFGAYHQVTDDHSASWECFVNPGEDAEWEQAARDVNGITDDMLQTAPSFTRAWKGLVDITTGKVIGCWGHYDFTICQRELTRCRLPPHDVENWIDLMNLYSWLTGRKGKRVHLREALAQVHYVNPAPHNAVFDAQAAFMACKAVAL